MALTKEQLIEHIYDNVGLSKSQSRKVVERVFEVMKETLSQGENLLISGFGRFNVKSKSARRGRNPHTTEALQLPARRVVNFKISGALRRRINARSKA